MASISISPVHPVKSQSRVTKEDVTAIVDKTISDRLESRIEDVVQDYIEELEPTSELKWNEVLWLIFLGD